jgi:hypothetical protein
MNKPQLDNRARHVHQIFKSAGFPLLIAAIAVFFGCKGSLSTYHAASSSTMVTGMAYYLPIGKITVKGEFAAQPSPNESSTTSPANGAKKDSGTADTTENLATTPAPAKEPADAGGKPGGTKEPGPGAKTISIAGLTLTLSSEVEADMDAERYVVHVPNAMFEDEIKLTVNSKHLLSAGKATTEDKTAEIVGTVASLAKAAITGPAPFAKAKPTPLPANKQPFYITFYPSSAEACRKVKEQLESRNIEFAVEPEKPMASVDVPEGKAADAKQGLVFRFAKVYKVHIKYPIKITDVDPAYNTDEYKKLTLLDTYEKFVLPDTKHDYVFEYPRLALVKAVNEVGFTDGMLTDLHRTRPSLIVGILSVPKAVAQAIIPGFPAPSSSGSSSAAGAPSAAAKN